MLKRTGRPVPWRTSLPVQLVLLLRDPFVTPGALDGLEARCRNLTRVEVDSGHWLPPRRSAAARATSSPRSARQLAS